MNKLINSEVNRCVLDDAMTGQGLEPCAPRWMSACHEQLGVWLRLLCSEAQVSVSSRPADWSSTSWSYALVQMTGPRRRNG